jgi:hypothetical protein
MLLVLIDNDEGDRCVCQGILIEDPQHRRVNIFFCFLGVFFVMGEGGESLGSILNSGHFCDYDIFACNEIGQTSS